MKSRSSLPPAHLPGTARAFGSAAACVLALLALLAPAAQAAQSGGGYGAGQQSVIQEAVVQPIGPSPGQALNAALARLARDPQNSAALVDAGNAALQMGDADAAIGFFTRANQIAPGNGQVKAQIGSATLKAGQPFEAIGWFDQAEAAGADGVAMASDRGLAYDLIGDNAAAQRQYQRALSRGSDEEATRRYALSLAIAGDRRGAEGVLAPQIQRQDRAAWRVRTFMVAILGDTDEAVGIANASMPASLAQGITPYLRYMPRLTPAQQAAAANLGRFPRAADIGRDEPRVVQYALLHPRAPRADSTLIPAGEALGGRGRPGDGDTRSKRGRARRGAETQIAAATPAAPPKPLLITTPWGLQPRPPAPAATSAPPVPSVARPTVLSKLDLPPPVPRAANAQRALPGAPLSSAPLPQARAIVAAPAAPPAQSPAPIVPSLAPGAVQPQQPLPGPVTPAEAPRLSAAPTAQQPAPGAAAAEPVAPRPPIVQALVLPPSVSAAPPPPAPPPPPVAPAPVVNFNSMFTDFQPPAEEQQTQVAAVDLTTISPLRPRSSRASQPDAASAEALARDGRSAGGKAGKGAKDGGDAKGKARSDARGERPDGPTSVARISDNDKEPADTRAGKVAKGSKGEKDRKDAKDSKDSKGKNAKSGLSHPSRIWVQVLTGANRDVMVKEWRSMVREAGELKGRKPYTTPWRSNFRLLTGPFESDAAAQDFIRALRKDGVSGFQWTSPAGQAIDTLQLK